MAKKENHKQTEIGLIPEEWKVVGLKEIILPTRQVDPKKTPRAEYKYIDITSILNSSHQITSANNILGSDAPLRARKLVQTNDVIVATTRPYLKNIAMVPNALNMSICSTGFSVLRANSDCVIPEWIFYNVLTDRFVLKISSKMKGATYPAVSDSDVINEKIPLPPLPEQQKIAEILSTVDEAIGKVDQAIEKTEWLKKGMMQGLFTKGIKHTEFKETELGKVPKKWKIKKLIDIATLQRGFDLPSQDRTHGIYPVIGSNGIVGFHNSYQVSGPGVIIGRSGTLGKVFYSEQDYWPLNTSLYVKKIHDNFPKYIYYFFQFINLSKYYAGTGVPTLNRNLLHPVKFTIPDSSEQVKIAEILSTIDKKLEILQKKKTQIQMIKKGFMNDLLTGRRRVKVED